MRIIVFLFITLFLGCDTYNNSIDPKSNNYSGFTSVGSFDKIEPIESDTYTGKAVLVSTKYNGDINYEYQVKKSDTDSWDNEPVMVNETNIINISHLNLGNQISYLWRVRGIKDDIIGAWSNPKEISTINSYEIESSQFDNITLSSNFLYIRKEKLTWGDSWEVRYKTDGEFTSLLPEDEFIFIENIEGSGNLTYQIREKSGEITDFWSREVKILREEYLIHFNKVLSNKVDFIIGSFNDDFDTPDTEIPLTTGFAMGQYEITNRLFCNIVNGLLSTSTFSLSVSDYKLFNNKILLVTLTNITYENNFLIPDNGYENFPVVGITWNGAKLFSEMLNTLENWDISDAGYSLPLEREWEYTASGRGTYKYPWGDTFLPGELNSSSTNTLEIGTYNGSTTFNCFDLAGNAAEWCLDSYSSSGYFTQATIDNKVIRGGSWFDIDNQFFNNSFRSYKSASDFDTNTGFRLVFQYGRSNE